MSKSGVENWPGNKKRMSNKEEEIFIASHVHNNAKEEENEFVCLLSGTMKK
jgi:hypothetical protein